ncbi:MAG: hypothetical protein A2289_09405 [Deltaproteobacteria bacterium RIFOXYA12_FULL_58_15]|nr:MAG: hypothetical protein A2289_09405 [Deltaproteobacteria bacterium RIFOXYA12_FULL_58_15]
MRKRIVLAVATVLCTGVTGVNCSREVLRTVPDSLLFVEIDGVDRGEVTSEPAGIDCGATCDAPFAPNTEVILIAAVFPDFSFLGWSGDCIGIDDCVLEMSKNRTVVARFETPPPDVQLSVVMSGSGFGTVVSSPEGIDCGVNCDAEFEPGSQATLTATPDSDSVFVGWSGDCSGLAACVLTMISARNVTARFDERPPNTQTLTVTKQGFGIGLVESSPEGIDCGDICVASFEQGTEVSLTATPTQDSVFAGFSGDCSGSSPCTVTVDVERSVTAHFDSPQAVTYALTVSKQGTGTGLVVSSPAGIDCGSTCTSSFDEDTEVTLTVTPTQDSVFAGFSGDCVGGESPCVLTMAAARNVTAYFNLPPPPVQRLTVTKHGTGSGLVESSPGGIYCGDTCAVTFEQGTEVTLTATADQYSVFAGFAGDCGGLGPCMVTMQQDRSVSALFEPVASCPGIPLLFSDETFDNADWDVTIVTTLGEGGLSSGTQVLPNGAPGAYRQVTNIVNDGTETLSSNVFAFHRFSHATYNPSVDGPIACVDYQEDTRMFMGVGMGQGAGAAIRQGGLVYRGPFFSLADTVWTRRYFFGLTANDFSLPSDSSAHPDFSVSGGPMEIGFMRNNSTYSGGYTITAGTDNWSFMIVTVE